MFRFEWLGLAVLVALTVSARGPSPSAPEPEHAVTCARAQPGMTAEMHALRIAEEQYRRGDSAGAAKTVFDAIGADLAKHTAELFK